MHCRAGGGAQVESALQGGRRGSSRGYTAGAPVEGALQGGRRGSSRECTAGWEEGLQ